MKILEVNDNDIYGRVFNGYDICEYLNKEPDLNVKQIVLHKFSNNNNVIKMFNTSQALDLDYLLNKAQKDLFSIQSVLSFNNHFLKNNNHYQKSDLIHYHQIHNSHFALPELFDMFKEKPTVLTLHDPWMMTGRCVHPMECNKWKNGCDKCKKLETLFDFEKDNSNFMWNIKKEISTTDIDLIVSSKFMYEMVKDSPYLKDMRVHILPFGLDLNKYKKSNNKKTIRQELGIPKDDIVLFFREQKELKGTNYIVDALKEVNIKQNVTLLTCSQTGLLTDLEEKYNIIELGNLSENEIIKCYQVSDIFLMPSLGESFGMMAIEAMACSLPVVVFNNTALPSVTNAPEVGILVNNKDAKDLKEKILYLINNETERINRGNLGRQYAEKNYDVNNYYKKLKEIYNIAYDKQKYKLKQKCSNKLNYKNIDFYTKENQKILFSLKKITEKIYLADCQYDLLKYLNPDIKESIEINNIKSKDDFLNIIREFNLELSKNIEKIDNKFNIRSTKLYKLLRKNVILRKFFRLLRLLKRKISNRKNRKYTSLNNEINVLRSINKKQDLKIQELNKSLENINNNYQELFD